MECIGKIWCETNKERDLLLQLLEEKHYLWVGRKCRLLEIDALYDAPIGFYLGKENDENRLAYALDRDSFTEKEVAEIKTIDLMPRCYIQPGDIVRFRSGDIMMIISDEESWVTYARNNRNFNNSIFSHTMYNYKLNLHSKFNSQCDIVAILKASQIGLDSKMLKKLYGAIFEVDIVPENIPWSWVSKENDIKDLTAREVTIEDIEKLFGYPVVVVKKK